MADWSRNKKSENGAALIESVFIIVFIILFAASVVEFVQAFRTLKFATNISREAANLAFRECSDPDYAARQGCLSTVQNQIQSFAERVVGDTKVIISLIDVSGGCQDDSVSTVGAEDDFPSAYLGDAACGALIGMDGDLVDHQVVVFAEVYVPYTPVIPFIADIFGYVPDNKALYDSAII